MVDKLETQYSEEKLFKLFQWFKDQRKITDQS